MPRASVVAKNYAKALYAAAKKNNNIDEVSKELGSFKENFSTSFAQELKNPVISKADLVKVIKEITDRFSLGKLTSSFFSSLVKNRRLNLFPEIFEEFNRIIRLQSNILEVEIITAVKPGRSQIEFLKDIIAKKYPGKTIAVRETIKEKILGGFQVKIGSEVIDASLQNQLSSIGQECLAAAAN
ncbi:MAG: ATP synthase F1 subunit delta [Rickettsiales bacterium]|nr:ATP synthase F1 subunit delta [Rickettsiales bacterium]